MMQANKKNDLLFLDTLRGLAAIYVMIGHARWLLWEGYSEGFVKHPEQYSKFNKCLAYGFSFFKYGHEVVLFFFVLSGFVIHLKYAKSLSLTGETSFHYGDYLLRRARRIYPPFLLAILITWILDLIGRHYGFAIYNGTTAYQLINDNIGNKSLSFSTLLGNLAFLFPNYFPLFGTNTPTWSLKYEWWFYMLYPLFLLGCRKNSGIATVVLVLLFIASFWPAAWPEKLLSDIFSYMLCWWLGVLLAEVYTGRIKVKFNLLSFLLLAFLICPLFFQKIEPLYNLSLALGFTGLLALCFFLLQRNVSFYWLEKLHFTGSFSYTLYIIHFPILTFISGYLMYTNKNTLPMHFGYVAAGIVLTIGLAYVFHFITEIPFLSKRAAKRIDEKVIPAA